MSIRSLSSHSVGDKLTSPQTCVHGKPGCGEQRLDILRLGCVGHVAYVETAALGDGLGDMRSWTAEGGSSGAGSWGGRGQRGFTSPAPVGGVEGSAVGADILVGRSRGCPVSLMIVVLRSSGSRRTGFLASELGVGHGPKDVSPPGQIFTQA